MSNKRASEIDDFKINAKKPKASEDSTPLLPIDEIKRQLEDKKKLLESKLKNVNSTNRGPVINMPRANVSSIKANVRGAKRELKIEKPVVDFHNPYFDPTIKTFHSRGHRKLKFSKQGKYVQQADQVRTKLKLAELQKKINDKAKDIGLEKQISISDEVFIVETVPQAEWWDLQFLPSHSYDDLDSSNISYELVGNLVHHPVQVKVHNEDTSVKPVFLTKEERKKLRRQRRAEIHEEKQEKIRLGLLPPEQSKLKLSNMMQVLTKEAVQDPTKVEAMVRAQMEQRKSKHEQQNAQRKLTDEQRREKTLQKLQKDSDKQVLMAVFKIKDLSHPQWKYKIDINAQQLMITGCCLIHPQDSVLIVEAGPKSMRQYKKLLLQRIKWDEWPATRNPAIQPRLENPKENSCLLVWEGISNERVFKYFTTKQVPTEEDARNYLKAFDVVHLYEHAKINTK